MDKDSTGKTERDIASELPEFTEVILNNWPNQQICLVDHHFADGEKKPSKFRGETNGMLNQSENDAIFEAIENCPELPSPLAFLNPIIIRAKVVDLSTANHFADPILTIFCGAFGIWEYCLIATLPGKKIPKEVNYSFRKGFGLPEKRIDEGTKNLLLVVKDIFTRRIQREGVNKILASWRQS